MRIDVDKHGNLLLKQIYNTAVIETDSGKQMTICMGENTIQLSVAGSAKVYRVVMETGEIEEI